MVPAEDLTAWRGDEQGRQDAPRRYDRALLCTVMEAAESLSLGRTTIYELLRSGQLRSVKVGARRFIPRAALEEFVDDLMEAS